MAHASNRLSDCVHADPDLAAVAERKTWGG